MGKTLKIFIGPVNSIIHNKVKDFIVKLLRKRGKKVSADFLKVLSKKISIQKQARHVAGAACEGKGFMKSLEDAQAILDAVHAGKAEFLGISKGGHQVFRFKDVTGTHVNIRERITGQPINIFKIKGTISPSVVPTKPFWKSP